MIAPATPLPSRPCAGFVIRPSVKQQTRMTPKRAPELSSRQISPERAQLSQLVFHPFFGQEEYRFPFALPSILCLIVDKRVMQYFTKGVQNCYYLVSYSIRSP
ncbi:hypothetical protein CDAR_120621 [Caerostris darwini]|uniref:Uncharacterized protein n=1 Tax=Caerostris darwini TaxID=1538125 RepID=A0AAV4S5H1_9ARAC|nr:hypothetical protein CDAR_120621 [Caerostris darwini]